MKKSPFSKELTLRIERLNKKGEELIKEMKEHTGLKNLYNQVISGKFLWDRWGLLSVLSDCILNYVKGDILEIGSGESSIYFSKLAEKYDRNCYHIEYSKSGVENMRNTKGYFGEESIVYNVKSDDFFEYERPGPLALSFIDGDHEYEQVERDFFNVSSYTVEDGVIFLHDTLPIDEKWAVPEKCGTVFILRRELERHENFDVFTFPFTAFGVGLTMVKRRPKKRWEEEFE
jgi:hypothetical protein